MSINSLYLDKNPNEKKATVHAPYILGSQGKILTTLYTPDGDEACPILIFAHGFPGHEKNIDLAHALRRIGFHVLLFYSSGCWGSDGVYSFKQNIEDTETVLKYVLADETYNFDKNNIFFLGHSYGCFAAARLIITQPEVKGGVFLMPCDFGLLVKMGMEDASLKDFLMNELAEGVQ